MVADWQVQFTTVTIVILHNNSLTEEVTDSEEPESTVLQ